MITLWAFHTSSVFRFSAPASALLGCTEPLHISPGLLNQSAGRVHGEAKPRVSLLMTLPHNNIDVRHYYSSCTSKAVKTSITRVPWECWQLSAPADTDSSRVSEVAELCLHAPSTTVQVRAVPSHFMGS